MAAFDVSSAIAEFAADPLRTSLELLHMTPAQRKSTKKLLEQYPELKCDSYGFGVERQLHLFKDCTAETKQDDLTDFATLAVNIKNTFIDDWAAETTPNDDRAVKSMPHGMFKQCLLGEACPFEAGYDTPSTGCVTPATVSEPDLDLITGCTDGPQALQSLSLSVGALVVVEGLVKAPSFNGRSGIVQGWDEATGRYSILLATSSGCQQAKVKGENLRVVLACP